MYYIYIYLLIYYLYINLFYFPSLSLPLGSVTYHIVCLREPTIWDADTPKYTASARSVLEILIPRQTVGHSSLQLCNIKVSAETFNHL